MEQSMKQNMIRNKALKRAFMKRKYLIIAIGMLLCIGIGGCSNTKNPVVESGRGMDLIEVEYRTDKIFLADVYKRFENTEKAYWKSEIIGKGDFGPTSYFVKGFVVLTEEEIKDIRNTYEFKETVIEFQSGIDPTVTGLSEFAWGSNEEFEKEIQSAKYIGELYFDMNHGLIYFDVENK